MLLVILSPHYLKNYHLVVSCDGYEANEWVLHIHSSGFLSFSVLR